MRLPSLGVRRFLSGIIGRLARLPTRVAGSPRALPTRLLVFGTVMAGLTFLLGLFGILASGVSIDADSGPVLRALFETLLNTYLWAFLFLGIAALLWSKLYDLMAAQTARSTRFSGRTIRRFAAEAKSTDGTVRLLGSNEHSRDQLFAKLMRVYRSTSAFEDERPGDETTIQTSATDPAALEAPEHGGAITERDDDLPVAADVGDDLLPERRANTDTDTDTATDTDHIDNATIERAGVRDALALMRMDLAASLNLSEVLWRWALPFALTVVAAFTLIQRVAVQWYVYLVVFAFAGFVATAYYGAFKWRRARRLSSLRREQQTTGWKGCNALAKRVDTDEATGYYAFVGGRLYFDFDAVRLAHTVADRWYRHLNDEPVPPAMQEKFARNVKGMLPTVYHTEHDQSDGRPAIFDDIIGAIADARDPHGIVPKSELCERVVERGRDGGHDPDVVAECYAEMVPSVVTEREIEIEDTDGERQTMTVVHLREHTITSQLAQLRSQFSTRVSADATGVYPLPDVERAEIDRERPPDIQPSRHLSRGVSND